MNTYDVAAYIWPSYTGDEPRTRIFWPEGIGEWETVKKRCHQKPLWGYQNEADPAAMEFQISQALAHGINTFIYDWYWYDNRPFLEQCLDDGFLGAPNNGQMKFFLMWANHTANTLWDLRNSHDQKTPIWDGAAPRYIFEHIARRWIENYFCRENYYKIAGKPVLSIFDVGSFIRGLEGPEKAREAIAWFRDEMRKAGFPGLHLQLIKFGGDNAFEQMERLGADSVTHYQTACYAPAKNGQPYAAWFPAMREEFAKLERSGYTYFPHVSVGWGSQPRYLRPTQDNILPGSKEDVKEALRIAKEYADAHPGQPPLVTLNSWNEWTETSYLQPDDKMGYAYLEAVKEVFSS